MPNPYTDPRTLPDAQDLLNLDAGEISTLAQSFSRISSDAGSASDALRSVSAASLDWTGEAADAFMTKIHGVRPLLNQIDETYAKVAGVLFSYYDDASSMQIQLRWLADEWDRLYPQALQAEEALGAARLAAISAHQQANAANQTFQSTSTDQNSTSQQIVNAGKAVNAANDRLTSAEGNLDSAQGNLNGIEAQMSAVVAQAQSVLTAFRSSRGGTKNTVSHAASNAPHPSFWDSVVGAVTNLMEDVGAAVGAAASFVLKVDEWEANALAWVGKHAADLVVDAGKSLVTDIVNLPHAAIELYEHPSLSNFEKFATDLGAVASVALMATGAGELMAGALGAEGAAAGLATAAEVADDASTVIGVAGAAGQAAKLGDDAANGNWKAAEGDALDLGADALGTGAGKLDGISGLGKAADTAEEQAGAVRAFSGAVADGSSPVKAYIGLSSEQHDLLQKFTGTSFTDMKVTDQASFLRSLDPAQMLHDANVSSGLATLKHAGAERFQDGLIEQGKDRVKAGIGIKEGE